jgi:hypothetical protein
VTATYAERDRQTSRIYSGVRVPPIWPGARVHAFHHWTGETTLLTWCGVEGDTEDGAETTTAFVNCSQCAVASLVYLRGAS